MRAGILRSPSPLPGFGLGFGITIAMISVVVLLPIADLPGRSPMIATCDLRDIVNSRRIWSALTLSFPAALIASLFNLFFGLMLASVLVRHRIWGRRFIDALVDLPFAHLRSAPCQSSRGTAPDP